MSTGKDDHDANRHNINPVEILLKEKDDKILDLEKKIKKLEELVDYWQNYTNHH